tara:strand:- start:931 stop:1605 length:675 start_codon:yes stop_codon:yes gene_type:complete
MARLNPMTMYPTPHKYRATDRRVKPVELVVVHYTAVPYYNRTPHGSNPRRIKNWLLGASRKSSTHYVVLRNGDVMQGAELDERTWHSGGSSFKTPEGKTIKGVNFCSIGVDFDNVGRLWPVDGGNFVDSYGRAYLKKHGRVSSYYKGPTPVEIDGTYWEPYSPESINSMKEVLREIVNFHPTLVGEGWRLVGHEDIRSTKMDPGPGCPMDQLREVFDPSSTAYC